MYDKHKSPYDKFVTASKQAAAEVLWQNKYVCFARNLYARARALGEHLGGGGERPLLKKGSLFAVLPSFR